MSETSNHDLVITRTFNAPACAVFDAWTKPEILKQWWAPKSSRLVWTNEESNDGPVTTLIFQETTSKTQLTLQERYPTKQALDAAAIGTQSGVAETFAQLDELLPHLVQKPDTAK